MTAGIFSSRGRVPLCFLLKAIPLTVLIYWSVVYCAGRFTIGIDAQQNICLGHRVYLIDHQNTAWVRGKAYQFRSQAMGPFFADGMLIVKLMQGVPGDRVIVAADSVNVNGQQVADSLPLLERLKKPASRFRRDEYLATGKFWFMGTSADSYDSRYWGTVDSSQIIGRAYAIW